MDDRLLNEFLADAAGLIEELRGDVAELRARRGEGRARRELVGRIFRRVHTIKGSAAAAGLEAACESAHEFESLLEDVRAGRVRVGEEVLEACAQAVEAIAAALGVTARGEGAQAQTELFARLRRLASSDDNETADEDDSEGLLPAEVAGALGAHERRRLREAVGEGARAYVVEADFDIATFDEQYRRLCDALAGACEVVATQPFVVEGEPGRVGFRIVCACAEPRDSMLARAASLGARLCGTSVARRGPSDSEARPGGPRAVPLSATLSRAAGAGESVAQALGKSVGFETAGGEVALDEALAAPVAAALLHLVRNAVDHGIEEAGERRAAGKDERGRVRIEALDEDGRVVLRVADDGRGVDAERVARAAAARGLVAEGERVTDDEALRLIFRPGFSTASRATRVSGRGVGLEVVARAVEEAGGEVRVRTARGRGTVFEMLLPPREQTRTPAAADDRGAKKQEGDAAK
ncbi:MAG TPA: ATP-binding protein [Pyrinomonadaceae bacterium]|nr:ATP-binding protein [Pyrinomonadaceae bacterium]